MPVWSSSWSAHIRIIGPNAEQIRINDVLSFTHEKPFDDEWFALGLDTEDLIHFQDGMMPTAHLGDVVPVTRRIRDCQYESPVGLVTVRYVLFEEFSLVLLLQAFAGPTREIPLAAARMGEIEIDRQLAILTERHRVFRGPA